MHTSCTISHPLIMLLSFHSSSSPYLELSNSLKKYWYLYVHAYLCIGLYLKLPNSLKKVLVSTNWVNAGGSMHIHGYTSSYNQVSIYHSLTVETSTTSDTTCSHIHAHQLPCCWRCPIIKKYPALRSRRLFEESLMADINIRSLRASLMGRWSNSWSISELKAILNYKLDIVFLFFL